MFQALTCPSSGGKIVFTQHLVSSLSVNGCTVHQLISVCWYMIECRHMYTSHEMRKIVVTIMSASNLTFFQFFIYSNTFISSSQINIWQSPNVLIYMNALSDEGRLVPVVRTYVFRRCVTSLLM